MQTSSLNVDPAELAKFSDLAHRWWDPESEFRPLHQINPLRLAWIDGLVPLNGQKVVDVGCGGGILSDAMALKGAQVLGIDLATAQTVLANAPAQTRTGGLAVIAATTTPAAQLAIGIRPNVSRNPFAF